MSKKLLGVSGLLIALALLIGINLLSGAALKGVRADMTEGKLYTLSDGSKRIISALNEPITLHFFYSKKLANNNPQISDYAKRVQELLEEYQAHSNGKIKLEVIDPEPFSDAEEQAVHAGLAGMPVSQQERVYMGLQAINTVNGREVIPFFDRQKESTLEYDVTKVIYDLAHPKKKVVTIVTGLPIEGETDAMARMQNPQGADQPWYIVTQLKELYDVRVVDFAGEIAPETDVLMVVHPSDVPEKMQYQIDQYVLKGGKTIIFADPLAESAPTPETGNPMQAMSMPKNSDLPKLFETWGIELEPNKIAGDKDRAQQVRAGSQMNPEIVQYLPYLRLDETNIDRKEIYASDLNNINLATAGIIKKREGADTKLEPILKSSKNSMAIDVSKVQMFPQPKDLLKDFKSDDTEKLLAVDITGNVKTAFPDGYKEGDDAKENTKPAGMLTESNGPINVVVFADVDMLADRTWVQVQQFMGMTIPQVMGDNGALVANLVDYFCGSEDLISIRSRGESQRPFTVVEDMQKAAQDRASEKITELNKKVDEATDRLRELQRKAPEGKLTITSPELQAEIEKARLTELDTKRELRGVELGLRRNVEALGTKLKFINIGLIPILVGVIAVALGTIKIRRRRRR